MSDAKSTPLTKIPGIGNTFAADLRRIDVTSVEMLRAQSPEELFQRLKEANAKKNHGTSRNYLYVIRMAVHFANGGRDPALQKWNAWTDAAIDGRAKPK